MSNFDNTFSIDTYKAKTAKFALENGFEMVNDITGGESDKLLDVVAKYKAKIIIMHMKGIPETMQKKPTYSNLLIELLDFFEERIQKAIKAGISSKDIILDPGLGFGKRIVDNDIIINSINTFKSMG